MQCWVNRHHACLSYWCSRDSTKSAQGYVIHQPKSHHRTPSTSYLITLPETLLPHSAPHSTLTHPPPPLLCTSSYLFNHLTFNPSHIHQSSPILRSVRIPLRPNSHHRSLFAPFPPRISTSPMTIPLSSYRPALEKRRPLRARPPRRMSPRHLQERTHPLAYKSPVRGNIDRRI